MMSSFNPLHCGAVVASIPHGQQEGQDRQVSIPFIAGQWSLPADEAARDQLRDVSIPFIAGQWSLQAMREARRGPQRVSIPFIAGQWSLRAGKEDRMEVIWIVFQSPSLRGSGRFTCRRAYAR